MLKNFYFFFTFFILIISFFSNNNFSNTIYYPSDYTNISSGYGYREINDIKNFHNGIDFLSPEGTNVYAVLPGVVSYVGFLSGYGNSVIILHDNGLKTLYGHLAETFMVNNGKYVNQSEIIGKVGPKYLSNGILNGFTTGPHLHFTIFGNNGDYLNPLDFKYKKRK